MPRHEDELELEVDDPLLVELQAEDYWYEAYNMRTGARGIFPAYYAIEVTKEPEHMAGSVPSLHLVPLGSAVCPAPTYCAVSLCPTSQPPMMGLGRGHQVHFTVEKSEATPPLLALPLLTLRLPSSPDQKQRLGGPVPGEVPGLSPGSLSQGQ